MQLHRSSDSPEWENTPANRNYWQRLAAATNGLLTPGNLITAVGFGLVVYGLHLIIDQQFWAGAITVALGRACDIADGWAAHSTGTKSPLGETLDAAIDKLGTALTIVAFGVAGVTSWWILGALLLPHVFISVIAILAYIHKARFHPSKIGKLSMAAVWLTLVGYLVAKALEVPTESILALACNTLGVLSVAMGLYACVGYLKTRTI